MKLKRDDALKALIPHVKDDDIVVADLDLSLLKENTGQRWIKTRRPELYKSLTTLTGKEKSTREQYLHIISTIILPTCANGVR